MPRTSSSLSSPSTTRATRGLTRTRGRRSPGAETTARGPRQGRDEDQEQAGRQQDQRSRLGGNRRPAPEVGQPRAVVEGVVLIEREARQPQRRALEVELRLVEREERVRLGF